MTRLLIAILLVVLISSPAPAELNERNWPRQAAIESCVYPKGPKGPLECLFERFSPERAKFAALAILPCEKKKPSDTTQTCEVAGGLGASQRAASVDALSHCGREDRACNLAVLGADTCISASLHTKETKKRRGTVTEERFHTVRYGPSALSDTDAFCRKLKGGSCKEIIMICPNEPFVDP